MNRIIFVLAVLLCCSMAFAQNTNTLSKEALFVVKTDNRSIYQRFLNRIGFDWNKTGRSFAIVAGISEYPNMSGHENKLIPAAEDMRKMINYVVDVEKFDEVVLLQNENFNLENMDFFLDKYFPERLKEFPQSRFLFIYSGHGMTTKMPNGAMSGAILTSDAKHLSDREHTISMATIRAQLTNIINNAYDVLVLINACYSGEFIDKTFGGNFDPRLSGAHAIVAGGPSELTWHKGEVGSGSVFFEKVLTALGGSAGSEGSISAFELFGYLEKQVSKVTGGGQNPMMGDLTSKGSRGGFYFFDRQPLVQSKLIPGWDEQNGKAFGASTIKLASQPQPSALAGPTVVVSPSPRSSLRCKDDASGYFTSGREAGPLTKNEECALKPATEFSECINCPAMRVLPKGSVRIGSPNSDDARYPDEGPMKNVKIDYMFSVGKFPITVKEFRAFIEETAYDAGEKCYIFTRPNYTFNYTENYHWDRPGFKQSDDHPVTCINWYDAKAYAAWLTRKTGHEYRLLSEGEWEYAARGTEYPSQIYEKYSFGSDRSKICQHVNGIDQYYSYNFDRHRYDGEYDLYDNKDAGLPCADGFVFTSPVGRFKPNKFGLYDVAGNVLQWVEDCYEDSHNRTPIDGSAFTIPDCRLRVIKSGSWANLQRSFRIAFRRRGNPEVRIAEIGFRVARSVDIEK